MNALHPVRVGRAVRQTITAVGFATRLFLRLVALFGAAMRRFGLVRDQIHFLGNHSLAIITVSGLFVGFVLGLQGYYTLQRYGSSEAVGLLVAHLSAYYTLAQRGPDRLTEVNNCTFELGKQLLTGFEQQLQNDASNHRIGT